MSAIQSIKQYASQLTELHTKISELDYVPQAAEQQKKHLGMLRDDLTTTSKQLKEQEAKTGHERFEHQKIRDSTFKKFLYRITGRKDKFQERVSKEERDFVDAWEKESQTRQKKELLQQLVADAEKEQNSLNEKHGVLQSLKSEQARLYETIFEGPTEEFPKDDQLEYKLYEAETAHAKASADINTESQALDLLRRANGLMNACVGHMAQALSYSTWDMFGGGTMADMMERNELSQASNAASQARMIVAQARQTSPYVSGVGDLQVPEISMLGDVFFDNIFSDMAAHEKIERSAAQLRASHSRIKSQIQASQQRVDELGSRLNTASTGLQSARNALDQFRWETIQSVAGDAHRDQPTAEHNQPPAYDGPSPSMPQAEPTWGSRNPYAAMLSGSQSELGKPGQSAQSA